MPRSGTSRNKSVRFCDVVFSCLLLKLPGNDEAAGREPVFFIIPITPRNSFMLWLDQHAENVSDEFFISTGQRHQHLIGSMFFIEND